MEFTSVCGLNEDKLQRVVLHTPGNGRIMGSSFNNGTETDVDYDIEGIYIGDSYRPGIRFVSPQPFTAVVDFGDGTVETYTAARCKLRYYRWDEGLDNQTDLTGGSYYFGLCPTDVYPYLIQRHGPESAVYNGERKPCYSGLWDTENNQWYNHINHVYNDDTERTVIVNLYGGNITNFTYTRGWGAEFPSLLELPMLDTISMSNARFRGTINFSLFVFLTRIKTLNLSRVTMPEAKLKYLPDTLFDMNLNSLTISDTIDDTNDNWWQDMNMDRLTRLKSLTTLEIQSTRLKKTPNTLLNLNKNGMRISYNTNAEVDYSSIKEVSGVIYVLSDRARFMLTTNQSYTGSPAYWTELAQHAKDNSIDVSKIRQYYFIPRNILTSTFTDEERKNIPEVLDVFHGLTVFIQSSIPDNVSNVSGWDALVEGVYNRTIAHPMSGTEDGHRNQYYYISNYIKNNYNTRYNPSGTYQAPEGFVQGESNGTPASPMEMIYVLTHNYAQTWYLVGQTATLLSVLNNSIDEPDHSAIYYNTTGYSLSKNKEGNYLLGTPDDLIIGVMDGSTIMFDTIEDVDNYIKTNDIYLINREVLDYELQQKTKQNGFIEEQYVKV